MADNSDFVDFVFGDGMEGITFYTHRTSSEKNAKEIMKAGLFFSDSFQKTTDHLFNDDIHIKYWQNLRKEYGDYTVIIGISTVILHNYQKLLNKLTNKNYEVQQVLTEEEPFGSDDETDEVYTLPVEYIKGYWDSNKKKGIINSFYDPYFDSPKFKRNIDQLMLNEQNNKKK